MAANRKYTLLQKLENLQSSFNLHIKKLTQGQAQNILTKLKSEFECNEYDHPEEKKRYYNLITYLHYFRRDVQEANQCNIKALEMNPESIIALGNQAWIYYLEHDPCEDLKNVEQMLKRVDELCTDRVKLAVAKSEIAYSYARFGMLYYTRAECIYEEVLNDVKSKDKLPVFLWQYGCGLTKSRLLRKGAIRDVTKDMDNNIRRIVSLLFQVARQDESLRFKARAWSELSSLAFWGQNISKHMEDFYPSNMKRLSATDMLLKALSILDDKILDIPVLENCAYHCKILRQYDWCKTILSITIEVKKSSRTCSLLAKILQGQKKIKQKGIIPYDEESQEILKLYDVAISSQNLSAMGYKGKFLMLMGRYKEAINVFEEVYRSYELMDTQQEEFDWKVMALCQSCHARCLRLTSSDGATITRAKELLWSAIELLVGKQTESQKHTMYLRHSVNEMVTLLHRDKTQEAKLEEIVLSELVGREVHENNVRKSIETEKMITVKQPELAQKLIKIRQFNEGLFHLNQMFVSNTLPEEMKEFAIEAHIDGANDALEKGNVTLAGKRALLAFDIRFLNENSSITEERLHVFFIANKCKQELTWKLQDCLTKWTSLGTTSCLDAMPGSLQFSSLEEKMLQSSVLAILFDEDDEMNDDHDSRFFKILVEIAQFVHMTHVKEKALIVITPSDQSAIPPRLSYLPRLPLGKLFQENNKKWLHEFFLEVLLKGGAQ